MKIQKIIIDNFRCFKHFEISFPVGVSLLIGRNGAGKTSLINAIVYALHFIFTNEKSIGDDFLSAGNPDLKMTSIGYDEFYREINENKVSDDANLHGEMVYGGKQIIWDMYRRSTPNSSVNLSRYVDAYHDFMTQFEETDVLPVLAYFSDSFPHKKSNLSSFAKKQIDSFSGVLRNFGYYQWDSENASTSIWQLRLINALIKSTSINDINDFSSRESNFVVDYLMRFSEPLTEDSDPNYEIKKVFFAFDSESKPELWLRLASGRDIPFSKLPAGYLRLYSIVLDIAYRAFLLNRNSNIIPTGLVIIDEIDLHLHPSLALEVVERFTTIFKDIQFIMSTHSPIVMSRIPQKEGKNKIFKVIYGKGFPIVDNDVQGIDYNTILTDFLNVKQNDDNIKFLKDSIITLKRLGRIDLVEKRKEELREIIGEERLSQFMKTI